MNEVSPRTAAEPMTFTDAELVRGAVTAGLTFVLVAPLTMIVLTVATTRYPQSLGISVYVMLIVTLVGVAPSTLLTVVVATPIARAVGRALRRERRRWPHLLAFAGLGAVASVLASTIVGLLIWAASAGNTGPNPLTFTVPFGLLLAPLAAGSSAWGWWRASRRALAHDAARETVRT
ncbi:MAG: hypothetical protein M3Y46_02080 [Actinomycetota bacterium]|jgi:hypothetical protein|nr:hypothetical protein [Actinomycetota bacterium]